MSLSSGGTAMLWLMKNIVSASNVLSDLEPGVVMTSDASEDGWGCSFGNSCSGGAWLSTEAEIINYLELKPVPFLRSIENFFHFK
ncbi:hypothetical protein ACOMHN_018828 [Nucella lapillus]